MGAIAPQSALTDHALSAYPAFVMIGLSSALCMCLCTCRLSHEGEAGACTCLSPVDS